MTRPTSVSLEQSRHATGIVGLDDILGGGLPANRLYLIQGTPGVGKTTLALQFLLEGARRGERVLYITLSETEEEIRQVAVSHGWSLDGLSLYELSSADQSLRLAETNTLYATADVDLKETIKVLLAEVERVKPQRVVFDSLSEIRLLAQTAMRYRRQLLGLKQYFAGKNCSVLLLDDRSTDGDVQVESLAHGVILLDQHPAQYGADRRRLRVSKLRGSRYRSGYHDFVISTGGLVVFPRLIAAEHRTDAIAHSISSGIPEIDALLGGGLDLSTATLLMGPAGTGKSAIGSQFANAVAKSGRRAAIFLFEERIGTFLKRAQSFGAPLEEHMASGHIKIHQIDPAEMAPDEFSHLVRAEAERDGTELVLIDSINGYFTAMPEGRSMLLQMHELLSFLAERGVASVMTMAQTGFLGQAMTSPVDISYLADTVMLLRYFEQGGRVRKAISVVKKRSGYHEDAIRELTLGEDGIRVGAALEELRGVFSGMPVKVENRRALEESP